MIPTRVSDQINLTLGIQTEELKVKKSIKDDAKKGQVDVAKILAKELVQSRKAVSKLYASKAQMNSVAMSMQQQLCMFVLVSTVAIGQYRWLPSLQLAGIP